MPRAGFGAVIAVIAALAALPARAACDDPAWGLKEVATLIASAAPVAAGASAGRAAPEALAVPLAPQADVAFALSPERPPKSPEPRGAVVGFAAGDAGTYRIALSESAWIDVVQDGKLIPSSDFSSVHDCPAIHKIVAFDIGAGPFTLQLSDATAASVAVAVVPAR